MRASATLALLLWVTAAPAGAQAPSDDVTSTVRALWREAEAYWGRLERGEATPADDPQHRLGDEMFRLFLDQPATKGGGYALESAFAMWANAGALAAIEQALERVDVHAPVWGRILSTIGGAYAAAGRDRDFRTLCLKLEERLMHPAARSELLLTLGDGFAGEGKTRKARRYYRQVLSIGHDAAHVRNAEGGLRELAALRVGRSAPDFFALDLEGNRFQLSELRGQVVLLDFWATDCAWCIVDIPVLREIRAGEATAGARLVGISLDTERAALSAFLGREQLPWPQILLDAGWESEIARLYNVRFIPRTYLIDRKGRIAAKDLRGKELSAAVARLLSR